MLRVQIPSSSCYLFYFIGVKGIEPLVLRIKNECLTAWLYSINKSNKIYIRIPNSSTTSGANNTQEAINLLKPILGKI